MRRREALDLLGHHAADRVADYPTPPQRSAWSVFAILFALMLVDYVDRQVVVSMFPRLRAEWGLSDSQLAGLVSIVSITVALGAVPLSLLADRWSRVNSIFAMVLIWSSATVACAFSVNYVQLLGARSVVGLGEAAYGTAGAALLATLFPSRMRSTILGAFLAAAVLGSALGVMLGGVIAERWSWQAAFGAVGVPGLIMAFVFLLLVRDYRTVALPGTRDPGRTTALRGILAELLRPRTTFITCIGAGLQLLAVSATYTWLPSYLNRFYGLPADEAGLKTALVVLIGGVGIVLWSVVADRLTFRLPCARLYVPAAAAVMTTLLMCTAFLRTSPGDLQFWLIAAAGLVMTGSVGPVAAVVIDVTHPGLRATAASVLALTQNLFGLAGGALLSGVLSDAYGLHFALSVVPIFCLLAAFMFMLAARTYVADRTHAGGAGPRPDSGLAPQATRTWEDPL